MSGTLYDRLEAALEMIARNQADQPDLAAIAAAAGMSPHHFQRTFRRWVGISPKRFLQYLTLDKAKASLAANASLLDAALDAGLSGPGRLHDLFVAHEAMTPGEHKRRGEGMTILWGRHPSPFGDCLLMTTERGICGLAFGDASANMRARWPRAEFREAPDTTGALAERIFRPSAGDGPLPLRIHGTNFQIRVWDALLRIPPAALTSYGEVAAAAGAPRAARAVGAAIGRNPISFVIPCHRVITANGYLHNYEWGLARKAAMIGWEAARCATPPAAA